MNRGAKFSKDLKHRLVLWRIWNRSKGIVLYVGVNPSTADAKVDDATIRRLNHFTRQEGYGGFYIINLYTRITPHYEQLKSFKKINSSVSNYYIEKYARKSNLVCLMYGRRGHDTARYEEVLALLDLTCNSKPIMCFGYNANGTPVHPLMIANKTRFKLHIV